jgi:thimet oligopeptidase
MRSVHPERRIREAAEECEKEVAQFRTELGLHRQLYDAVEGCREDGLDAPAQRMLARLLREFHRFGVDRDEDTRRQVERLRSELVALSQEFARNISTDVRWIELDDPSELDGLPEDYVRRHSPGGNGKIRITTDYPDYNPFMAYARNARLREELYRAFRSRAHPANLSVLKSIVRCRHELSSLLGYAHWADYATEDKMIRDARSVEAFIDRVSAAAEERSVEEYAVLLARKREDEPDATEVFDWEKGYYEERVRAERYDVDSRELRPYLRYESVKAGVLAIVAELFGVELRTVRGAPAWHDDVEVLDVVEGGEVVGRVYLDMHPREGKFKHAAMFPIVLGLRGRVRPVAALVCNFPNPRESDGPALLEHDDLVTLFHEFGHVLHHLFARDHDWVEFSGTGAEWDFVEVPSQLFEEWAWAPEVLERFANHWETGETIAAELVARLRRAREFGQGLQVRQQMYYASLSLRCHNTCPDDLDIEALQRELQNRYSRFRFIENTHFLASFGHLDSYSALYYTYMWSMVIEKDLLSRFEASGLMDVETARRYRAAILEPGGSRDAADLVRDFLGRDYNFEAFRRWLGSDSTQRGSESSE